MAVEATFARAKDKRPHPAVPELVGGVELTSRAVRALGASPLAELLTNAEYWLSFELATFEPILARAPTPLRELGVGVVLRYGEGLDGRLTLDDLARARAELPERLPPELARAVELGLATLERAVAARSRIPELEARGYARYTPSTSLSIHGLRAGGTAHVLIDEQRSERDATLDLGQPHGLQATDERGRALGAPELESELGAPVWALAPDKREVRSVVVIVPGRYRLRVPGRAEAARTVLAR